MTTTASEDLREIAEADVYVDDEAIASLSRARDDVVFNYATRFSANGGPVRERSVAWSLLVAGDYPRITTAGAVPPFFAGLLPEGVRLGVVLSSTKTSPDDHFTLLLAIGADTTGNVRVVPAGTTPPERLPMFEPERAAPVAKAGYAAMRAGRVNVIPGLGTKIMRAMSALSPSRRFTGGLSGRFVSRH
jgi:serine/threonine-protein kinase HipA